MLLKDEYDMLLSEKDKREVNEMCNLSEAIWDKGVADGFKQFYENLKISVQDGRLSLEDASAIAPDSEDFLAWYKMQVN